MLLATSTTEPKRNEPALVKMHLAAALWCPFRLTLLHNVDLRRRSKHQFFESAEDVLPFDSVVAALGGVVRELELAFSELLRFCSVGIPRSVDLAPFLSLLAEEDEFVERDDLGVDACCSVFSDRT